MKRVLLVIAAGVLASLAFASVAGACTWLFYQPPVPKSLQ